MSILSKLFGDANEKYIESLEPIIARINELEEEFQGFSDEKIKVQDGRIQKKVK